jgi:hypothetical protein
MFQIIQFEIISGNKIQNTVLNQLFQCLSSNTVLNRKNERTEPGNFLTKGRYFPPQMKRFSLLP